MGLLRGHDLGSNLSRSGIWLRIWGLTLSRLAGQSLMGQSLMGLSLMGLSLMGRSLICRSLISRVDRKSTRLNSSH